MIPPNELTGYVEVVLFNDARNYFSRFIVRDAAGVQWECFGPVSAPRVGDHVLVKGMCAPISALRDMRFTELELLHG